MAPRSSLIMSRRSRLQHQPIRVGLVAVALATQHPVLEFSARRYGLVGVRADQAVAGDGLEVTHIAHGAEVAPGALDAEEAVQQELVGDVTEDASDVDGAEASLHRRVKREAQHLTAIPEVAAGVAVGPGRFQEQLLQTDAPAELLRCRLQRLLVVLLVQTFELGGQRTGGFEDLVAGRIVRLAGLHREIIDMAPGAQDLQLGLGRVPALSDGFGFDLGEVTIADVADLANRCDAIRLRQRLGPDHFSRRFRRRCWRHCGHRWDDSGRSGYGRGSSDDSCRQR